MLVKYTVSEFLSAKGSFSSIDDLLLQMSLTTIFHIFPNTYVAKIYRDTNRKDSLTFNQANLLIYPI